MDPALTWEILSSLSSAAADGDGGLPFYAQREEASKRVAAGGGASSSGGNDNDGSGPAFLEACPLLSDGGGPFPALYSREAISDEFTKVLQLHRGRIPSSEMGTWLGMEEGDASRVADWLCPRRDVAKHSPSSGRGVCKVLNPTTQQYDYAIVENLRANLRERIHWHCRGRSSDEEYVPSLSDVVNHSHRNGELASVATVTTKQLAQELELTVEDVAWLLEEELGPENASSSDIAVVRSKSGAPVGVYNDRVVNRWKYLEGQLSCALAGVTVPTSLAQMLGEDDIEGESAKTAIGIIQTLVQKGELRGTLSVPSQTASLANAIYTPHLYSHAQRKMVDSFYRNNGYMTVKKCMALGLSRNRIEEYVKVSFPNAVLLANSIIDPGVIFPPLESAIQYAVLNKTFADVRSQLPSDIASSEEDVKEIIHGHLDALLREQPPVHDAFTDGLTIVNVNMVLFFSKEMVEDCRKLLTPLVEEYSKRRAREIITEAQSDMHSEGARNIIPLRDVANAVGEKYPDLLGLEHEHGQDLNAECELSWIAGEGETGNNGPLVEFCRSALFSSELQRKCARSVKAELDQLDATRHGVSVTSQAAAKIQNIGDSFESSFRTLCHLLQFFSKSLDTIGTRAQQSIDDEDVEVMVEGMKRELLLGCGSCLARLITEYCLFKHEGEIESERDGSSLFFEDCREPREGATSSALQAINVATMTFPFYVLRCKAGENGKSQTDPVKYLQSTFPGSPGLNLSEMWRLISDGNKLESFVQLLGEACLTLVGVPFSMLDKKTERKVLASRREGLLERLQSSTDKQEVATCATILIYQQVKNLPIAGIETISMVMRLFEHDKKIPRRVTEDVLALQNAVDEGNVNASSSLILRVKRFGSAKNGKALATLIDDDTE